MTTQILLVCLGLGLVWVALVCLCVWVANKRSDRKWEDRYG